MTLHLLKVSLSYRRLRMYVNMGSAVEPACGRFPDALAAEAPIGPEE